MPLLIKDQELNEAQITEEELRLEIAILLYQQNRLSTGKASEFANMNKILFLKKLAERKIAANYDSEEFKKDLETLGIKVDDSNK